MLIGKSQFLRIFFLSVRDGDKTTHPRLSFLAFWLQAQLATLKEDWVSILERSRICDTG